jgi:hypothetical protein
VIHSKFGLRRSGHIASEATPGIISDVGPLLRTHPGTKGEGFLGCTCQSYLRFVARWSPFRGTELE